MNFLIKAIFLLTIASIIGLYSCSESLSNNDDYLDTEQFISSLSTQSSFDLSKAYIQVGKSDQLKNGNPNFEVDPMMTNHFVVVNLDPTLYSEEVSEIIPINKSIKELGYDIDFAIIQTAKEAKQLKAESSWVPKIFFWNSNCYYNLYQQKHKCKWWLHTQLLVLECISNASCEIDIELPPETEPVGGN